MMRTRGYQISDEDEMKPKIPVHTILKPVVLQSGILSNAGDLGGTTFTSFEWQNPGTPENETTSSIT